jgi:hypothetical protein
LAKGELEGEVQAKGFLSLKEFNQNDVVTNWTSKHEELWTEVEKWKKAKSEG